MYKELCVIIIILIFIFSFNIITQNYTKESVQIMNDKLNSLKESILTEEDEKAVSLVEEVLNDWKERKGKLEYYIEHDELEKVETELMSLKGNIEIEKYKEGVIDIQKSMFILNHIKEKFAFRIQNIF